MEKGNDEDEGNERGCMERYVRCLCLHWSRSHFITYSKCDLQVNYICEAFNREILEHREKPIVTLLEGIKHYITKRMISHNELLHGYT